MNEVSREAASGGGTALGLATHGGRIQVYGESAFHYFLGIERERSSRSGRHCYLVLIDLRGRGDSAEPMPSGLDARLFAALWQSVRDTDFLGWYRQGRVAGVLLTEVSADGEDDVLGRVMGRIRCSVEDHLPVEISSRLDVRASRVRDEGARS